MKTTVAIARSSGSSGARTLATVPRKSVALIPLATNLREKDTVLTRILTVSPACTCSLPAVARIVHSDGTASAAARLFLTRRPSARQETAAVDVNVTGDSSAGEMENDDAEIDRDRTAMCTSTRAEMPSTHIPFLLPLRLRASIE